MNRFEEGQIVIQISEVRLGSLLENIGSKLAFEARSKNIEYRLPKQKKSRLLVDESWLESILLNLLTNAIAHSPPGSLIEIDFFAEEDRGSVQIKNPIIELLSADDLVHVFDCFWNKDVVQSSGQHVGIGLALVKFYAKCLGLSVMASIDEDSKFCIRLSNIKLVY